MTGCTRYGYQVINRYAECLLGQIQDWTIDGNRTLAIGTNRIITVNTTCRIALNWEFGNSTTVPTGDWAWMADIDILVGPLSTPRYHN